MVKAGDRLIIHARYVESDEDGELHYVLLDGGTTATPMTQAEFKCARPEESRYVLDACCGSRMFWYDRQDSRAVFMDCRRELATLCDGRKLAVEPDIVGDFRDMPFPDERFRLVVFDPPHTFAGASSWLAHKYGRLDRETWRDDLRAGFLECFRVLEQRGVLVFKWSSVDIPLADVLTLAPCHPLMGSQGGRQGKTHFVVFVKDDSYNEQINRKEELEPYYIEQSTSKNYWEVWKKDNKEGRLLIAMFHKNHPHSKETAESERDRLNAEYRKDMEK